MNTIKVWDVAVRLMHWSLAALVLANFINEDGAQWHRWGGYAATAIVLARVVWGFVGTRYARFSEWFPTPQRVMTYIKLKRAGQAPRFIGHNPLGALMMLLLMALVINQGVTGYMMGTDAFWGEHWLEEWHEISANLILGAVALHVLGAVVESVRTRENLIAAMIHGKKRSD